MAIHFLLLLKFLVFALTTDLQELLLTILYKCLALWLKLDWVGPVDNKPFTFVTTLYILFFYFFFKCHMTRDTLQVGGGEPSLKISAP